MDNLVRSGTVIVASGMRINYTKKIIPYNSPTHEFSHFLINKNNFQKSSIIHYVFFWKILG